MVTPSSRRRVYHHRHRLCRRLRLPLRLLPRLHTGRGQRAYQWKTARHRAVALHVHRILRGWSANRNSSGFHRSRIKSLKKVDIPFRDRAIPTVLAASVRNLTRSANSRSAGRDRSCTEQAKAGALGSGCMV